MRGFGFGWDLRGAMMLLEQNPPEMIGLMQEALDASVATLPEPVSSAHVQSIAETILRTAKDGERDPKTLQRMALIELQISPRHG